MLRTISRFIVVLNLLGLLTACSKDEPKKLDQDNDYVAQSIEMLSNKSLVLDTKAMMGEEDKTLLPKGAPTKFHFKWLAKEKKMQISMANFKVGKMPFQINFRCYVPFEELDTWDKDLYTEKGWIKFQTKEAWMNLGLLTLNKFQKKASKIEGFFNPVTKEIRLDIDYNMMSVKSICKRQKIDFNRIHNYEEEVKQYGKDLEAYKKAHGIR